MLSDLAYEPDAGVAGGEVDEVAARARQRRREQNNRDEENPDR